MKLFTTALLASVFTIAVAQAQTADDIIKKNVDAVGGADKLKAIQTEVADGKFSQGGIDVPFVLTQKRPNKFMIQATFQGKTQVQSYDGSNGWSINPFQGRDDAEKMDADNLKTTKFQADIDGPLVDYAAKGYKVEYVGEE